MSEARKAAEIVCLAKGKQHHVLARVTVLSGHAPDLVVTPGIDWFASEVAGAGRLHLTCKHGACSFDLEELLRDLRSSSRRIRRTANSR